MTHEGLLRNYARYIEGCRRYYGLLELPLPIRAVREVAFADDLFAKAEQLVKFADGCIAIDRELFRAQVYQMANQAVAAVRGAPASDGEGKV